MEHFTAHRLRFVAEVTTPIELYEHMGGALRGAFFNALSDQFCVNRMTLRNGGCPACPWVQTCPVAFLVATLDPRSDRGENVPRPYTIEPSFVSSGAEEQRSRGEFLAAPLLPRPPAQFEFGLTMFARAMNLFPYVVLSLQRMEQSGIGRKVAENGWRRGTFRVHEVWAENPLTGERQRVLSSGDNLVQVPDVPVTHAQVCGLDVPAPGAWVRIDFLTPTRLTDQGRLAKQPDFRVLFQRLMERLVALAGAYCDTPLEADLKYRLVGLAAHVGLVEQQTRWVELESYSSRQKRRTPIGGLVGYAVYAAEEWGPFWPWLKWGELTHVGKNAVKGDGVIQVSHVR